MQKRILLSHGGEMLDQYFGAAPLAALQALCSVTLNETGTTWTEAELIAAARGHAVVVLDRTTAGPPSLFSVPGLAAVCRVAVDIRNIDVEAASRAGILVTRASAGFCDAVAEWIVGAMIDLSRGLTRCSMVYRAGDEPMARPGRQIGASTVGIIGYGQIARRLCGLLGAFGCRLIVHDPYVDATAAGVERQSLDALLRRSDFVICLATATPETENLMGAQEFSMMKPGSFFVNASRGNLVDEAAIENALSSGHLAGVAMDVGRAPDQKPSPRLAARSNVIATPHTAGNTPEAVAHQAWEVVRQVESLLKGEAPEGSVNAAAWTRAGLLR